ncbi:site-specific integrase [Epibacterium sp. MM17-32]|uniref:tyrosine-type recombinase/integrase n=1 Tax=Epibacterium sp. MM17-32 TaxID=2917734 RepID=UPI001EF671F5|nr:site-specific integrase [Epibacterium sp. MM17-32]MCG7628407.1 site-specific integrase [Epibacterium sp. MM17-32]
MATHELPRGIRKRGAKYFVDVTHQGKRKTATVATLHEAMAKKSELTEALTTGKEIKATRANAAGWTLQQALDKVLSLPKPEGWRGCSYEKQATLNVQDAIKFMGPDVKLEAINRDLIDAWLHDCEARSNSDSTINRKVSALSKVLKLAIEYGGLDALPKMPMQRKERVSRIRFITKDEETALYQFFIQIGRDDMAAFVMVLIETGMRRGELMNLRPVDVDLKSGVIMVYGTEGKGTKNGKIRSVAMTKACRGALQDRMTGATCFDLSVSDVRHLWDRARMHLGLADDNDFVLHVCRHTCASRLVKAGVSLPTVQQWLGHSSITTTMRYAHLYPQDIMNAAKALEGEG